MELSRLDSNKCRAILAFKHRLTEHPEQFAKLSVSDEQPAAHREIDKFGEITTKKLQQPFRIPFNDGDIDTIISMYNAGVSTHDIAKQYGCSKNTISSLLKRNGINVTNRKAQSRLPVNEVIKMYDRMDTTEKIAGRFGVSVYSIRKCLRENGVKIRNRWDYDKI